MDLKLPRPLMMQSRYDYSAREHAKGPSIIAAQDVRQVDPSSETISPSSQQNVKAVPKISCLACRAAKRKCNTPDAHTVCKRCKDQGLECQYKKHQRGRKRKYPIESGDSQQQQQQQQQQGHGSSSIRTVSGVHSRSGMSQSRSASRSQSPERTSHPQSKYSSSNQYGEALRSNVVFSHVVPNGDSSPYLPVNQPKHIPVTADPSAEPQRYPHPSQCPDPVSAGYVTMADAEELFDYYFANLNSTVAILDPVIHSAARCRQLNTLLFTSVVTVTSRIGRPKAYPDCLALSNRLLGQVVEYNESSLNIVLSLLILTHWKKADDASSWRKIGLAIRMAQELRLHKPEPRPLPRDEREARETLTRERAWINLVIADYHLAMHHSLPRMIADDAIEEPAEWIAEHEHLRIPGEEFFAPWIEFSRLIRLFAEILGSMTGSYSNLRSLAWLEDEERRWRKRWLEKSHDNRLQKRQMATIWICDNLIRFHIAEYQLLFCARYRSNGEPLDTSRSTPLSHAFAETVERALGMLDTFQNHFVANGFLQFSLNVTWVGLAVCSVWLAKNIGAMDELDRSRALHKLQLAADATDEASISSDDMAAYSHRLLKHLLGSVNAEWRLRSSLALGAEHPPATAPPMFPQSVPIWELPSTQEMIQETLWANGQGQNRPGMSAEAVITQIHGPNRMVENPLAAEQVIQPAPPNPNVIFPTADDDIWKILFPM